MQVQSHPSHPRNIKHPVNLNDPKYIQIYHVNLLLDHGSRGLFIWGKRLHDDVGWCRIWNGEGFTHFTRWDLLIPVGTWGFQSWTLWSLHSPETQDPWGQDSCTKSHRTWYPRLQGHQGQSRAVYGSRSDPKLLTPENFWYVYVYVSGEMGISWDIMVINVDLGPLPIGFVKRNLAVFSSSGTLQNTIPVKPMFNGYVGPRATTSFMDNLRLFGFSKHRIPQNPVVYHGSSAFRPLKRVFWLISGFVPICCADPVDPPPSQPRCFPATIASILNLGPWGFTSDSTSVFLWKSMEIYPLVN